ncbi:MAG: signal peptidase II [Rhizobiaceae bacterium]
MRVFVAASGAVGALVAIDQLSKWWVETTLPFQRAVDVIPFLALYRTWNEGIAFSMLAFLDDTVLAILSIAVSFILLAVWRSLDHLRLGAHVGFTLVMGGAIGNLIDRLRLGHVVDFVLVHAGNWSFAVFNLADAFVTVGAGLILLDEFLHWYRGRRGDADPQG